MNSGHSNWFSTQIIPISTDAIRDHLHRFLSLTVRQENERNFRENLERTWMMKNRTELNLQRQQMEMQQQHVVPWAEGRKWRRWSRCDRMRCQHELEMSAVGSKDNKFVAGSRRTLLPLTSWTPPTPFLPRPIKVMRTNATKNNRKDEKSNQKKLLTKK